MLNYEVVQRPTTPQTITDVINTIPHYKQETGWGIFKSKTIAIIGIAHNAAIGKRITATGIISTHPEHGKQLHADSIIVENPDDKAGLINMLAKAKIKGVGAAAAAKIVNHFGVEVMHQLTAEGLQAAGLSVNQAAAVMDYAGANAGAAELLTLLGKAGIHSKTQAAIIASASYDEVKRNPFRLLEIPRMSFTSADAIWRVLNGDNKATTRIFAGVTVAMERQQDKGHSGMNFDALVLGAADLLKIDPSAVQAVVTDKLASRNLIEFPKHSDCIYTYKVYQQEREIASLLTALQAGVGPVVHTSIDNPMLSDEQLTGIQNAMIAGVSIITGGPGTGKSTLLLSLCDLATLNNLDIRLTAPTGMAANRMRAATGRKANTIHKFLLSRNKKPVLLVVDEASMLSTELLLSVLRALPAGSRLVLIGDADQLPSIQYGNVLNDLIDSGRFPVTRLTKTFRFKDDIGKLARDVITGNKIVIGADITDSTAFIDCTGEDADLRINEVVMGLQARFKDAQVLAPIRGGVAGTGELNQGLADLLNPDVNRDNFKRVGVGDRVVNTKNDYDKNLVNGYTGIVMGVDSQITVRYEVGDITQSLEDANIELAYALTVHKVQGQEYETVIIALSKCKSIMLQRRLLYTAVTRAKNKVIIVGTRAALDIVQSGQFTEDRLTGLGYHL